MASGACNVFLLPFLLMFLAVRAYPGGNIFVINSNQDVGEHYRKAIATCHDLMRFNGLDFILGSGNLFKRGHVGSTNHATVHRRRKLHLCIAKHSGFLQALFVAMLVCGDVELNPGPNYKFPCGACSKPVKSNQMGLLCATCQSWFHTKCEGISSIEYARLYDLPDELWFGDLILKDSISVWKNFFVSSATYNFVEMVLRNIIRKGQIIITLIGAIETHYQCDQHSTQLMDCTRRH